MTGEQQAVEDTSNQVAEQPAGETQATAETKATSEAEATPETQATPAEPRVNIRPQHNGPNLTPRAENGNQAESGRSDPRVADQIRER